MLVTIVRPRTKSAVLWGAVGLMSFLVLIQGYAVFVEPVLSLRRAAAIGLVVGAGAGVAAYAIEHRVAKVAAKRAQN